MKINYEIILTIVNLTNDQKATFLKDFEYDLQGLTNNELYNNYHKISDKVQMFTLFKVEIHDYCITNNVDINNIDIDEFNINSKTDKVDVFFENEDDDGTHQISLNPIIKCYIEPKEVPLDTPDLIGQAYDNTTIIWSWEDDGLAHYLVSEATNVNININIEDVQDNGYIIAQLPIGTNSYTETGLESNTAYTRRLVSYNAEQSSDFSMPVTVYTATAPIDISLEQYNIPKNYDLIADDTEREIIEENLEAFHSGVGDFNDLKVYKQMDSDYYQKFKAYIKLRGERSQLEKRYDSVGFNYKVCLEAEETVEEQKGEVTFDIEAYPRESISIKDYMYATQPVTVCARLFCDVLLKKPEDETESIECPIEEPEWEKQYKKVPNLWVIDEPEPVDGDITIVLSFDISGSMNWDDGNGQRYHIIAEAGKQLIDKIEGYSKDGKPLKGHVNYAITMWGQEARTVVYSDAVQAKACIDSVHWDYPPGSKSKTGKDVCGQVGAWNNWQPTNLTNHYAGLTNWIGNIGNSTAVAEMFFTDGFANDPGGWTFHEVYGKVKATDYGSKGNIQGIYNSITQGYSEIHGAGATCYTLFGANYQTDCDRACLGVWNLGGDAKQSIKVFDENISNLHKASADGFDIMAYSQYTINNALVAMWNGLKALIDKLNATQTSTTGHWEHPDGTPADSPYDEVFNGWKFKGWKPAPDGTTITTEANWNIDKCVWAHIIIPPMSEEPWQFTIDESITPVVYARNEQRAIIPSDSIIRDRNFDDETEILQEAIKISDQNLQQMILTAVQETEEWANGYNKVVEAYTEEENKQGKYIIRGLFIKDTYKYADEDTVPDVNFTDDGLEDGYVGSINVYADINKMNTPVAYGDDIYYVGEDKFVWLSGYTDAIIYDGERIESFELNASHAEPTDKQTEILVSPEGEYKHLLWNRKNNTIQYTGENNQINHCIDLIIKDKDIYITGCTLNALKTVDSWTLFMHQGTDISDLNKIVRGATYPIVEILEQDIVAHNDEAYLSPILNYRFSIEDPDAYTSYYELLPDCDPYSECLHIVFVHIYYAKNVYIQDEEQLSGSSSLYIELFPTNATDEDKIATKSSPYYNMPTQSRIPGSTYFREEFIDDYIWFKAKPMMETRPYYDEKPNAGMDTLYGNVNGRYKSNNKTGKFDLKVATPMFNLPTTIDANDIKIYIMISEFYPPNALVSYKWEHPLVEKDDVTKTNGDYVTFSSDSLTQKKIVYTDLIKTITTENIELFDNKTTTEHFNITQPMTKYNYDHYYVDLSTNNSDVIPLNYPSEIVFDEEGNAEFNANFKGVVNATTKWSPRIHNGYYYLNQHEYYAYSEFDVDADWETFDESNYKIATGFLTIDVQLKHAAGQPEHYEIIKNTRSEITQDEKKFKWIDGKGLTIKPVVEGIYYKEYATYTYYSPTILFPNKLSSAGQLKIEYTLEGTSKIDELKVRAYDMDNGKWTDWVAFSNNSVPNIMLSCAYQFKCDMSASVIHKDKTIEDYLCCYLDWKDEADFDNHTNIVTITDHLKAGPDESDGIFISNILDYGCETTITFDMFSSNINSECELYVSAENSVKSKLDLENVLWTKVSGSITIKSRYFRYKIVVPYGERVYWLHKQVKTKETEAVLPYIRKISMTGDYTPSDTYDMFQEVQSFEILTDGMKHRIFPSVYDIISGDIENKGFTYNEIQFVKISCTNYNITLEHNSAFGPNLTDHPTMQMLNTSIYATADFETEISSTHSQYMYAEFDKEKDLDIVHITRGTPQQFAPITVEDINKTPYKEIFDVDPKDLRKTEKYIISTEDDRHYLKISRNDYDPSSFEFRLNGNENKFEDYNIINNLVTFNNLLNIGDELEIEYNILYSFYTEIDYENNQTQITIYSNKEIEDGKKYDIDNIEPIIEESIYNKCDLQLMYSTGVKETFINKIHQTDEHWGYDPDDESIIYNRNYDGFSVLINDWTPVKSYTLTIIAGSNDDWDNDIIGIVVGYLKDSAGIRHTLSYLVNIGNDFFGGQYNACLIMDYQTNNPKILQTKSIDFGSITKWCELGDIKFYISKQLNQVQCKMSNIDDIDTWNEDSIINFDLNSNIDTKIFNETVYFGFCVRSQSLTYFKNPVFNGKVDKLVSVEEQLLKLRRKYKVFFETNTRNNKFVAEDLSLNPVYRTDYKGFIYLTDEHFEPYVINIYRNPEYIRCGGYDKIDVSVECLDYLGNPVVSKEISIDCKYGILIFDNDSIKQYTDINGVVHFIYQSSVNECEDMIIARTLTSDESVIEASVRIVNEKQIN